MNSSRLLLLVLPSLVILVVLVAHSAMSLPRARAGAFWLGVIGYGVVRGAAVRWVSVSYLGGGLPYVVREPVLPIAGVSLQEVAGWAIVVYLGWWVGSLFTTRWAGQVLWACLLLASASWAVESTAIAIGWWRWTVPVPADSLTGVPFIGIVDWFFVGIDFLLPFVASTTPGLRNRPSRYLTLLAFPAHFGAHLFVQRMTPWFPIPPHHLMHWLLLAGLFWFAARSRIEDRPFTPAVRGAGNWLPLAALGFMLVVLAGSDLLIVRRPGLLMSLLPLTLSGAAGAVVLLRARRRPANQVTAWSLAGTWLMIGLLGVTAGVIHESAARSERELTDRLDHALALRERGDLRAAAIELEEICRVFPGTHVPRALLGEMSYRAGRLDEARRLFSEATGIQQSYADGFRYLAVIELRQGRSADAARRAAQGLEIEPDDPQLRYLALRGRGESAAPLLEGLADLGPSKTRGLAALAFEVNDLDGAGALMEAGLARWPDDREFHKGMVRLALARGDTVAAHRAVEMWLRVLPDDAEALDAARNSGAR